VPVREKVKERGLLLTLGCRVRGIVRIHLIAAIVPSCFVRRVVGVHRIGSLVVRGWFSFAHVTPLADDRRNFCFVSMMIKLLC